MQITMDVALPPSASLVPGRYAAIDIGTVTARLLIADILEDGHLRELCRDMEICNLGIGVDKTRRLSMQAINRTGEAVDRFMGEVERFQVGCGGLDHVMAVATSASRDAANAEAFRCRLARSGIQPQVISGSQEAALSFAGATASHAGGKAAVIDVGGGSTEVVAGIAGSKPVMARSFDVGCRRATERFLLDDPPTATQLASASRWITDTMKPFIGEAVAKGCFEGPLLAVAGTATSCVTMRDAMETYNPAAVHGSFVSVAEVDALVERLASLALERRREVPGLESRRAEVIVAGLLILKAALSLSGADGFTVSELDILHGVILQQASRFLL